MAVNRFVCPSCSTGLRLAAEIPAGKSIKCPKCQTSFLPDAGRVTETVPAAPRRAVEPADDDDEIRPRRSRSRSKRAKQKANPILIIIPVAVLLLVLVGGGIAALVFMLPGKKTDPAVASAAPTNNNRSGLPALPPETPPTQPDGASNEPTATGVGPGVAPSLPGAPPVPPGPASVGPGSAPNMPSAPGRPTGPNVPGSVGPPMAPGRPTGPDAPTFRPSGRTGLEVGDTVPEIAAADLDGKKFKLSDYRGKVVVIDFWGHW